MSAQNSRIPAIKIHLSKALQPHEVADRLVYPHLDEVIGMYEYLEDLQPQAVETETLSAQSEAALLVRYRLLRIAQQLQRTESIAQQQRLTQKFTETSVDFYGAPNSTEVAVLLAAQYEQARDWQRQLPGDERCDELVRRYAALVNQMDEPAQEYAAEFDEIQKAARYLGDYLRTEYARVWAVFEGDDQNRLVEPPEAAALFEQALLALKAYDERWANWCIVLEEGKDTMSSLAYREATSIGANRVPEKWSVLKGLFGHEVLCHGLRSLNGRQEDEKLGAGLPGYINAEEGWAGFIEYALSGVIPPKITNRYLDIAYALGLIDGTMHNREEVRDLALLRELVRSRIEIGVYDEARVTAYVTTHVNRIFRGTLGNDIVGVYTKDIVYYVGYQKIARYVTNAQKKGISPKELFLHMSQGKFDPTNKGHVAYLSRLGSNRKNTLVTDIIG